MSRALALSPSELRGATPIYLLDVVFAGRTFRLATRTCHVTTDAGEVLIYRGQLNRVEYVDEAGIFDDDAPRRSVPVEFRLPVDVTEVLSWGHSLDGVRATLSLWLEGRTWEQRIPKISGLLEDATHNEGTGAILGSIVDEPSATPTMYPDAGASINESTWGSAPRASRGIPYPTIIGQPGVYRLLDGTVIEDFGSLGHLLDEDGTATPSYALLIAGHEVAAGTVKIWNITDAADLGTFSVQTVRDGLGQVVSVVDLTSAEAGSPDFVREFAVRWNDGAGGAWADSGGGAARRPLRGAGDVLAWCLRRTGRLVDWATVEGIRHRLNRWQVDAVIEASVDLYTWLGDTLLRLLPVWRSGGPRGLRVGLYDPDLPPAFRFRAPRDGDMVGAEWERGGRYSEASYTFALDRANDTHWASSMLRPDFRTAGDVPSSYAVSVRDRYGRRVGESYALDITTDRPTVDDMHLQRVRRYCSGWRVLTYQASTRWLWLEVGKMGRLTEPTLKLTDAPVMVSRLVEGLSSVTIDFIHVEDQPGRRADTA